MQPEEFMREYFHERTERIRCEMVRRNPFRQKFYTSDCYFDSQQGAVEQSEAEQILGVSNSDDGEVLVVTSGLGTGERRWRVRYHLRPTGDRWLIRAGELECGICRGTGKKKDGKAVCPLCNGRGWMWPKDSD